MTTFNALIIGASSTIAQAAIKQLESDASYSRIYAISRSRPALASSQKVIWIECDNTEASIQNVCQTLKEAPEPITKVLICNGILHNQNMMPEKKLEEVTADNLNQVFHANTIVPMLWLSRLAPILKSQQDTQIAILSARVGSISDNQSGGWYSYRASKAALNMLIKNSSIEYARRAKNVKLIAFHPGTTDTPLSKPFQRGVPEGKLFTAEFVASQLLSIMDQATMDNKAAFLDWNNQAIDW